MQKAVSNLVHRLKPNRRVADWFEVAPVESGTAKTLETLGVTIPDDVHYLEMTAESDIRYIDQDPDNPVDPTATKGQLIPGYTSPIHMHADRARQCKFIAVGAGTANLNISKLGE